MGAFCFLTTTVGKEQDLWIYNFGLTRCNFDKYIPFINVNEVHFRGRVSRGGLASRNTQAMARSWRTDSYFDCVSPACVPGCASKLQARCCHRWSVFVLCRMVVISLVEIIVRGACASSFSMFCCFRGRWGYLECESLIYRCACGHVVFGVTFVVNGSPCCTN